MNNYQISDATLELIKLTGMQLVEDNGLKLIWFNNSAKKQLSIDSVANRTTPEQQLAIAAVMLDHADTRQAQEKVPF